MLIEPSTLDRIIKQCIQEQVGLVIDRLSSSSWIFIPASEVNTVYISGKETIVWSHGAVDIQDVSAIRCGGKPGQFMKEILGEERAKDMEDALDRLRKKNKN